LSVEQARRAAGDDASDGPCQQIACILPRRLAGPDGLTGVSDDRAAFPAAPDADMMAPGSRGGDISLRGGCQCRDSA